MNRGKFELIKYELHLARNLRALMGERRISISSVAREIKIDRKRIYSYLTGAIPQQLDSIQHLADFFRVTLTDLLFSELKDMGTMPFERLSHVSIEVVVRARHEVDGRVVEESEVVLLPRSQVKT